jgi:hypothetical protein
MQDKLKKLEEKYSVDWREYELQEIFNNIQQGKRLKKSDQISGELPFVMAGRTNTGIVGYISNPERTFPANSITVDIFGNTFYRGYEFGAGDDTGVYWNNSSKFNKKTLQYISAIIEKSLLGKFDFGKKLRSSQSLEFKIELPTQKSEIAFDYIEEFVETLEAERLATLEAYLLATGLSDYKLTKREQEALNKFGKVRWKEYSLKDVLEWQQNISELSPLSLDRLSVDDEKKYPFYGQSTTNKGIIEYRHLVDNVLNNKLGKPTILIHSNNQNIVYLNTPFYLKDGHGATSVLQAEFLNRYSAFFVTTSIKKAIVGKFSYNAKATKINLKNTSIKLPVDGNDEIDYDFIENLIKVTEKVVIKDIIEWFRKKLDLTEKVINHE